MHRGYPESIIDNRARCCFANAVFPSDASPLRVPRCRFVFAFRLIARFAPFSRRMGRWVFGVSRAMHRGYPESIIDNRARCCFANAVFPSDASPLRVPRCRFVFAFRLIARFAPFSRRMGRWVFGVSRAMHRGDSASRTDNRMRGFAACGVYPSDASPLRAPR